jgi:hypothetical protein
LIGVVVVGVAGVVVAVVRHGRGLEPAIPVIGAVPGMAPARPTDDREIRTVSITYRNVPNQYFEDYLECKLRDEVDPSRVNPPAHVRFFPGRIVAVTRPAKGTLQIAAVIRCRPEDLSAWLDLLSIGKVTSAGDRFTVVVAPKPDQPTFHPIRSYQDDPGRVPTKRYRVEQLRHAAQALKQPNSTPRPDVWKLVSVDRVNEEVRDEVREALRQWLPGCTDPQEREEAFEAFAMWGTPDDWNFLAAEIQRYPQQFARSGRSIGAIGFTGCVPAAPTLVGLLPNHGAWLALLKIGEPAAPAVCKGLQSPNRDTCMKCLELLEEFGTAESIASVRPMATAAPDFDFWSKSWHAWRRMVIRTAAPPQ